MSRETTRRTLLKQGAAATTAAALTTTVPRALAKTRIPRAAGAGQRVAVLGGGMAGLAAAHELAERGFRVDVYERKGGGGRRFPRRRLRPHAPGRQGAHPPGQGHARRRPKAAAG